MLSPELVMLLYKLASLLSGVFICYLGYRLFMKGIFGPTMDASFTFKDNSILIKKSAPGTFFSLLGATVICFSVYKGLELENKKNNNSITPVEQPAEKPLLKKTDKHEIEKNNHNSLSFINPYRPGSTNQGY